MGYTNYWTQNETISDESWMKFVDSVKIIFEETDVPLAKDYDYPRLPPVANDRHVEFNGIGSDGYETFYVNRFASGFCFCKTARKPYNEVVEQCCEAATKAGVFESWSHD